MMLVVVVVALLAVLMFLALSALLRLPVKGRLPKLMLSLMMGNFIPASQAARMATRIVPLHLLLMPTFFMLIHLLL